MLSGWALPNKLWYIPGMSRIFPTVTILGLTLLALMLLARSPNAQASDFKVLYQFTGGADGGDPQAGLVIGKANVLYGTASVGGGVALRQRFSR